MGAAVDLDATFQALADPTRRGVIELLRTEPRRDDDGRAHAPAALERRP